MGYFVLNKIIEDAGVFVNDYNRFLKLALR